MATDVRKAFASKAYDEISKALTNLPDVFKLLEESVKVLPDFAKLVMNNEQIKEQRNCLEEANLHSWYQEMSGFDSDMATYVRL